eukprot:CAMPEP_0194254454 /NCGR_PEP_ID=MMETSP0158-20130606/32227_1 /TAXON_ID=33649 /ORGANISM="Thalassionema nitzschioides, Strain L26-B" /LENGTH=178 /DNA_ID=CAMNT_0038992493 /DNA_START=90 /DNA_END=623 /DNA_ORIENTATION=+
MVTEIDDLLLEIMSFVDVLTLENIQKVNGRWEIFAEWTVNKKLNKNKQKKFQTKEEIIEVVRLYDKRGSIEDAEWIARTYGWPIDRWDVSEMTDLSTVFAHLCTFNEDIRNWDTSNVKKMVGMFYKASSFNQDIRSWNVSKVEHMTLMFTKASAFNQDISNWDTKNVKENLNLFLGTT